MPSFSRASVCILIITQTKLKLRISCTAPSPPPHHFWKNAFWKAVPYLIFVCMFSNSCARIHILSGYFWTVLSHFHIHSLYVSWSCLHTSYFCPIRKYVLLLGSSHGASSNQAGGTQISCHDLIQSLVGSLLRHTPVYTLSSFESFDIK